MKRFIAGAMAGAVAMYLLDPDRGRSRRARIRQQGSARARSVDRAADCIERDAANRAEGARARADGKGVFHPSDDRALEVHLHQVLEELDVATSEVTVESVEGVVRVRGQVGSEADIAGRARDQRRAGSARRRVAHAPARRARAEQEAGAHRGHLSARSGRRRGESNPCTGLCRPLPKPLGHVARIVHPSEGACIHFP